MKVKPDGASTIDLGTTETTPTIGITDYSKRVTDDFGVTTVVERGFSRRMSVRMALPTDTVDAVQRQLANLRATSALWIADASLQWLNVVGFYKDFALDLAVPPLSFCTLTVEGLAETEVVADGGGDPAPAGSASTLRLLQPITVDDAQLFAASVPENDAAAWASGTTYADGAHVIRAHRIWESLVGGNVGNDPTTTTGSWLDTGPTNRWAMFDQALGTATTATGSLSATLAPSAPIGAVAFLDAAGATVRVQAMSGSTTVYDQSVAVGGRGVVTFTGLPQTANLKVIATLTGASGSAPVSLGTLLAGAIVPLGITEASPSAGITDYSRKEVDDFGAVTIVQRAWAKRMSAQALIRSDAVDLVANRIAAVRARPALWIGDSGLDSLSVYGFFKDFSIEVGDTVSKLSLSIEGLSKAAPVAPPFGNGQSVVAQGSADGVAWHLGLLDGDVYMRISNDSGATFGPAVKVVGDPGASGYSILIDNEAHQLPADVDGNVLTYDGAAFSLRVLYGQDDVTGSFTAALAPGGNPQGLSVVGSYPNYQVNGGFDADEDSATFKVRLTGQGSHAGVVADRIFSLTKSRAPEPGVSPPLVRITSSASFVKYTAADAIASGPITFYAQRTNTDETTIFRFEALDGDGFYEGPASTLAANAPGNFSSQSADEITVSQGYLAAMVANDGAGGFRVSAVVPSGARDRLTLLKTKDGAPAQTITLSADKQIARYSAANAYIGGPITFTAIRQNIPGTGTFFAIYRVSDNALLGADTSEGLASTVPSYYAGSGGDKLVMSSTAISDIIAAHGTFRIEAFRDGYASRDSVSIMKVQDGQSALNAVLSNPHFGVPTAADGSYSLFPVADSQGNMTVYLGTTDVTAQCTFTVQNPANLATSVNAAGAYSSSNLYADTGYSFIVATYNGQAIALKLTANKNKAGVNGETAPDIKITASSLIGKQGADGNYVGGQSIVLNAQRNAAATAPTYWRLYDNNGASVGNGYAQDYVNSWSGAYWTSTSNDNLTLNLAGIAYFLDTYGGAAGRIRMRVEANGVYDEIIIQKLRDGANGADGFALDTETTNFVQPVYSGGASKPTWTGGSGTIRLNKGGQRITTGVTYAVLGVTDIASLSLSGDTFSFAGATDDAGEFTIRATYNGVNYDKLVSVKKVYDGEAAFKGSVAITGTNVAATTATGVTTAPGGRGLTVSAAVSYIVSTGGAGSYQAALSLYWRNVTDNGPWNLLGTQNGSGATRVNQSSNPQEPEYVDTPGTVSAAYSFTGPSSDKQIGFEARVAAAAGVGPVNFYNGSVKLEVSS